MKLTHKILANLPLCKTELDRLRAAVPSDSFDAVTAIHAYVKAGGIAPNVARAYQTLVNAGLLPDVGLIWKIARIAFREQAEASGLRVWAVKLRPDNWQEAYAEAAEAADAADATTHAALYAAYTAALYAAEAYIYLTATYAAAAAHATYAAAAARERVDAEIINMIIEAVE
jgi:hypothetical protein